MDEYSLDYFYGLEADEFTFIRVPKLLFTHPAYKCLTSDDKLLYGILLDRIGLSVKNRWIDEQGRAYIIFTIEDVMSSLNCAGHKAVKMMSNLENKGHLIERKRQGQDLFYTVTWTNPADTAKQVIITDRLPEGVEFVSAEDEGVYNEETGTAGPGRGRKAFRPTGIYSRGPSARAWPAARNIRTCRSRACSHFYAGGGPGPRRGACTPEGRWRPRGSTVRRT